MSDYQKNCRSVADCVSQIEKIFAHPDWKIERFKFEGITPHGGTVKFSWDRKDVGQAPSANGEAAASSFESLAADPVVVSSLRSRFPRA